MPKKINLQIGEVRGNRKLIGFFGYNQRGRELVKVKCLICGEEKIITKCTWTRNVGCKTCKQNKLTEELVKRNTTHGLAKNKGHRRLYDIFMGIIDRCNNKNNHAYKKYGGRGIKCEWNNVEDFFRDMKYSYEEHCKIYGEKNTTIDRIDTNGNYSKDNCRRATRDIQQNNRTNNNYIEIDGVMYNSESFSKKYGISKSIASNRICGYLHGRYTLEHIIKQGQQYIKNMVVAVDGKKYNSKDIVKISGCAISTAIKRIHKYEEGKITKEQLFEKPQERYLKKTTGV